MDRSERNQYSPAGQVDQWGDLAEGLRNNRSGRRRAFHVLIGLAAVFVALVLILILAMSGLFS